jgi:hypothetical protein
MSVATSTCTLPFLEAGERLRALRLRAVAVDALARDAVLREELGEAVAAVLGAREDDHVLEVAAAQQLEEQVRLDLLAHRVERLRHAGGRQRDALLVQRDRVPEQLARELADRRRHRRAEEQRLPLARQARHHAADVGEEAHVEHAVGLVEHERLEPAQPGVRLLEVVEQAAGRGDEQVDAAAERLLLRPHADAAEHRGARELRELRQLLEVVEDLRGELARRREHHRAGAAALAGRARRRQQPVRDREQEGGGLAAAGHRAGEQVAAGERGGDGLRLDRRRGRKAHRLDPAQEVGVKAEGRKRHEVLVNGKPRAA